MTTTIIIYRLTSEPSRFFAHVIRAESFEVNGIPTLNAETVFYACVPSRQSTEVDRVVAQRFALAEQRWPLKLPVQWDDTGEMWKI